MLRRVVLSSLCLAPLPACDDEEPRDDDDETGAPTEAAATDGDDEPDTGEETAASGPEEPPGESVTPLVLAFAGEAVRFNTAVAAGFDLTGTMSVITDWPTSTTPWLALDRDGNGRVDDGGELFGSATLLASGVPARHGFAALRELDDNHDGRIDASDPAWARLLVWSDVDSDRRSAADELRSVTQRELVAIDLHWTTDRRCDARGNCEVERATFIHHNGGRELQGAVVDVHLQVR